MSETEQAPASGGVDVETLNYVTELRAVATELRGVNWSGREYVIEDAADYLAQLTAALRETTAELTALRARVEAAERLYVEACGERDALAMHGGEDKARLDWLQKQVHDTADGSIGDVTLHGNWTGIAVVVGETPVAAHGEGLTLRAAIDAALSPPAARGAETTSNEAMQDDVSEMLTALGLSEHARPVSPHRVVQDEILPAIRAMKRAAEAFTQDDENIVHVANLEARRAGFTNNADALVRVVLRIQDLRAAHPEPTPDAALREAAQRVVTEWEAPPREERSLSPAIVALRTALRAALAQEGGR